MRFTTRGLNMIYTKNADVNSGEKENTMSRNAFMQVVNEIVGQTIWKTTNIVDKRLSIKEVLGYAAEFFDTPLPMVTGRKRDNYLVEVRQMATRYLRANKFPVTAIAYGIGNRHYSSVIHYEETCNNLFQTDIEFAKKYLELNYFLNSKEPKNVLSAGVFDTED